MITLATARADDVPAIAELAAEMDRFYGAAELDAAEVRQEQIDAALFGDPPTARALLAWDGAQLAGFASYSFLWPAAGLTGSLYLKELYVAGAYQRSGVGKQLMQGLFEVAVKCECSRVEWTTDRFNAGAQAFYEAIGAGPDTSKIFYRVEGGDLLRAVGGQDDPALLCLAPRVPNAYDAPTPVPYERAS